MFPIFLNRSLVFPLLLFSSIIKHCSLKKAFLNEQCLIEENSKRGKTRDLFRKLGNIKGALCPKMGTKKNKNGRDLVAAENIKKQWKENIEELYKKRS